MATENQMIGNGILDALKFEFIPSTGPDGEPICGGEQKFKATSRTAAYIKSLLDENSVLVLDDAGEVREEAA